MKKFILQTNEVMKVNLRQLVVFQAVYRLVAGAFYVRLADSLVRFSLEKAGYSYLTMSNLGEFLLRPWTAVSIVLLLFVGAFLIAAEVGGILTAYQAAAYSRRVDCITIFRGAVGKTWDEIKKRDWQLLPLAALGALFMNGWILLRAFSRIRPFDFIMDEILAALGVPFILAVGAALMMIVGLPIMLVFFACMVEQKRFADGARRSRELLAGRWPALSGLLLAVNGILLGAVILLYGVMVLICALFVTLFGDAYTAAAVLTETCMRLEAVLLMAASLLAASADYGALTVAYYQFDRKREQEEPWDFTLPYPMHVKKKWFLRITAVFAGISLFMVWDMAANGSAFDWSTLGQTEITAHRGSSRTAPENTLAALTAAMEEMADFAEIDVQMTSDSVVVLCHDSNLKRVAGVNQSLSDLTFAEAEELDVGSFFSPEYAEERIPSLEQALELCRGKIKLNIELKDLGAGSELPEKTAEIIKELGMEEQCVISSVRLSYLGRVKEVCPELKTGYILPAAYGKYYENEAVDFISIRSSLVTRRLVESAHEAGRAVHVWTVNSRAGLEAMWLLGVDNLITDYPARAREILYEEAAPGTLLDYLRMLFR